jgi:hypothetical protein
MSWVIKYTYPSGGHIVKLDNIPERFVDKREAEANVEMLNAKRKDPTTFYIVVEEK